MGRQRQIDAEQDQINDDIAQAMLIKTAESPHIRKLLPLVQPASSSLLSKELFAGGSVAIVFSG